METIDYSLIDWSRAQFALTAMYHWIFVPLTLGLGVIMSIMETIYYRTGDEEWKKISKFWMNLFGVNFAIGVATGIIMEFQFGTNWSNYSWFVGDIFGAPLAIEGILAFFMESTFIAVMFFGWGKVSKGFHLASTWLTVIGATLSALWILVANAWMQYPVGMHFNPDTVRNEMADFWAVLLSPVAINKFTHTVTSSWVVGAIFVVGISAWYLLKQREVSLARKSIKVAAIFGLVGSLLTAMTGDGSAYHVAQQQPMKLAAMEGLYEGRHGESLVLFGVLNSDKKAYNDSVKPYHFKVEMPQLLSFLAYHDFNAFVPGVKDIVDGGFIYKTAEGKEAVALSAEAKMASGKLALQALSDYKKAKAEKNDTLAAKHKATLEANYSNFGYGFVQNKEQLIPNLPLTFYSFHIMVALGIFFILLFFYLLMAQNNGWLEQKWLLWVSILSVPLVYLTSQCGWIVAEVGRQPWVIQDIMPSYAAVSKIEVGSVQTTFFLFAILFTVLLVAEVGILIRQIKKGSEH